MGGAVAEAIAVGTGVGVGVGTPVGLSIAARDGTEVEVVVRRSRRKRLGSAGTDVEVAPGERFRSSDGGGSGTVAGLEQPNSNAEKTTTKTAIEMRTLHL